MGWAQAHASLDAWAPFSTGHARRRQVDGRQWQRLVVAALELRVHKAAMPVGSWGWGVMRVKFESGPGPRSRRRSTPMAVMCVFAFGMGCVYNLGPDDR